jgi:hypothetical protein
MSDRDCVVHPNPASSADRLLIAHKYKSDRALEARWPYPFLLLSATVAYFLRACVTHTARLRFGAFLQ